MTTESQRPPLIQFLVMAGITALMFPVMTLGIAGDWLWVEGWLFALWFAAMVLINMSYLYWKDPALLAERSKAPGSDNQKSWDKYVLSFGYFMAFAWFILMPLDAKRFGWSPEFPLWLKVLGGLLLLPAIYFIEQATIANTYMSTLVRIQEDRKQSVISTGVYGLVRHPLYLGVILMLVGGPLLLGSLYGLVLSLISFVGLIGRIMGEEKMLVNELEGYEDYKKKVHYRLIPFVW